MSFREIEDVEKKGVLLQINFIQFSEVKLQIKQYEIKRGKLAFYWIMKQTVNQWEIKQKHKWYTIIAKCFK